MRRHRVVLIIVTGALAAACASIRLPAPRLVGEQCVIDPALVGTWTDSRMSQLGPGWAKFTFRCDCSFSTRIQLLFARITESGQYRASGGQIQFERASGGGSPLPYRFDGGRLHLTEYASETYEYKRDGRRPSCGG
jgi:hypothetical protein